MDKPSRAIFLKIALDSVCLLLVGIPILILFLVGKPYERGFFCDDESLKHPYKDSTVPNWVLYVFGLGIPITTIVVTELTIARYSGNNEHVTILNYKVPGWIQEAYKHIGVFGFGAAASQLTTDIGKYTIGRLRPHFFDVCNPDVNCALPENINRYIIGYQCRNSNMKLLKDMKLSFPSGHSSFSMYCMLFFAMYIQSRFTWRQSKLARHVLQFVGLSLAVATALSRISDYKHHWSDVLFGFILGSVVAIIVVLFVSDLFPARPAVNYAVVEDELKPSPAGESRVSNANVQQTSSI